ncbi:unnamed protein product [Mesocestoides corti]|uniref:BAR domain-containing protein n=1 Tax=Mesocestoides corti TaxID=53468 RepID=A0A0R3UPB3_MESCO|nr:unnamed protein product [Mesocestoides corti]
MSGSFGKAFNRLTQILDQLWATKMVETFQKNKEKTTTSDRLGAVMEEVATQSKECAPKLSQMLLNASDVQKGLATAKKNFNTEINTTYIDDLKSFLNNEVKEAQLEAEMRKDEAEFDKVHKEAVAIFEETCRKFDEQNVQLTDLVRAQKNFFDACSRACAEMVGA